MQEKYDRIGIGYNETRKADPYLTERLYSLLEPSSTGTYLDIGCGTGNYTHALWEKGLNLIGIEPSGEMLSKGRLKNPNITWMQGYAEQLPMGSRSIDGILASLTIHHWKDLASAFNEIQRVLIPEGGFVIFTSTPDQMKGYWLNHYFPKMLHDSISQMPSYETVAQHIEESGLSIHSIEKYFIQNTLEDLFLYCGKHRPQLYLDPHVRRGISSFSDLAHQTEINIGLNKLEEDIKTNSISEVIKSYHNEKGDYLFIVGGNTPSF